MVTRSKVSEDVYEKEVGLTTTRRRWIREHRERLTVQLQQLKRHTFTPEDIEALLRRVRSRLSSANPGDRRFVSEAVGASVFSCGDGSGEIELEIPDCIRRTAGCFQPTRVDLPLKHHLAVLVAT